MGSRSKQSVADAETPAVETPAPAETPAVETPAVETPAPVLTLAELEASRGTIKKAARQFVDVPGVPRVMLPDGRIGTVQREVRADLTEGPAQISILRPGQGDPNAGTRWSLSDTQAIYNALAAEGVPLFTVPAIAEVE